MNKTSFLFGLILCLNTIVSGQTQKRQAHIYPATDKVVIDGDLSDGEWREEGGEVGTGHIWESAGSGYLSHLTPSITKPTFSFLPQNIYEATFQKIKSEF